LLVDCELAQLGPPAFDLALTGVAGPTLCLPPGVRIGTADCLWRA